MTEIKNAPTTQAPAPLTPSQRFTNMVIKEMGANGGVGTIHLTDFQKRLCQNYFIEVDKAIKKAEIDRLKKADNKRDAVPVTWENVNMTQLALDVVSVSRVGLDPALNNHIFMVPYKNANTGKYDINFTVGYKGKEIVAKRYGLDVPDDFIIELVYSTDHFKVIKKDIHNRVEGYEFEIKDHFNRGELIGGFYYFSYFDHPEKNFIRVFNKEQIEKRRPNHASPEFWGGEKDEWVNGNKTGRKIKVEGWYDEMCYKTISRACFGSVILDSQKIDEDYMKISQHEKMIEEGEITVEAIEPTKQVISIEAEPVKPEEAPQPLAQPLTNPKAKKDTQAEIFQQNPDF